MTEPLRVSLQVDRPVEHAFWVWTAKIALWWPVDHTVSAEPGVEVVLEPRVGGRLFERTTGGAEHDWGEVTVFEPPRRLGYRWHLPGDRTDATEVHISFVPDGEAATRIEIERRGWERLGAQGPGGREANRAGWNSLLPHFTTFLHTYRPVERTS